MAIGFLVDALPETLNHDGNSISDFNVNINLIFSEVKVLPFSSDINSSGSHFFHFKVNVFLLIVHCPDSPFFCTFLKVLLE